MPPSSLCRDILKLIKTKLIEKTQGSVSEMFGYVICVIKVEDIAPGVIMDTTGDVLYRVKYRAIVMKPIIGEVSEGVIEKVEKYGIHVGVGPMRVFISHNNFPPDFTYDENTNTYISPRKKDNMTVNTEVRFRITGIQYESNNFYPIGTMYEDYLGPIV
jgi:DNA-directed RNA polymerase subunit E'/Rpb7